jgi:alpha-galactosidase
LGAHIGPAPAHTTGRSQSLDFRAAVALPCHLGVEMDLRRLDSAARSRLAQWIQFHKCWRARLHGTAVFLGEAGDGIVWQAHGDQQSLLLLVYRLEPTTQRYSPSLRLPMLDRHRSYRLRRVDPDVAAQTISTAGCAWLDQLGAAGANLAGAWLNEVGLPLPRLTAEAALLIEITAL